MGCPMMFARGSAGADEEDMYGLPPAMFLPAPMAMFGVLVAFMFGMMMGVMIGKKKSILHGKPWMKPGMHHHHGYGMPGCRDWHGGWAAEESSEMPEGEPHE